MTNQPRSAQPPQWLTAVPGLGGGWDGGPGPSPYGSGWVPGYPPPRPRRTRLRSALLLGIASLLCGATALAVGYVGVVAAVFGEVGLLTLAGRLLFAASVLAVASVVLAAIARGAPVLRRVGAATPALVTLLAASFLVLSARSGGDDGRDDRSPAERTVEEAARALSSGDTAAVCELLASAASGDRCARDPRLRGGFAPPGDTELLDDQGGRVLVRYQPTGRSPHRVRLVIELGQWRLLDLPGRYDECVDTAEHPFGCPVVRYGRS